MSVSVIVPAYNETFERIECAVSSAVAAGADEIVIVDDGSTEGGHMLDVACDIPVPGGAAIGVLPRNAGISAALNFGIRKSSGDWVCWLSCGDTMHSNKLECQLAAMDESGGRASFHSYVRRSTGALIEPAGDWRRRIYADNQFSGSTIMVARDLLEELGGFDESLRWCQDWDLAVRIEASSGWLRVPHCLGTGDGVPRHSASGDNTQRRSADRAKVAT